MIVKIGNKYYDSSNEPILLILSEEEKQHISNMEEQIKYCSFPEEYDLENIKDFMK